MYWKFLFIPLLMTGGVHAADLAITQATVFDATGAAPYQATVVIDNGVITAINPPDVDAATPVIDAEGLALLPGFFDVHVHFTPRGEPPSAPRILQAYAAAGVTSVFNFHSPPEAFDAQRAWFESLPGPHVNFVARMSTPGGHGAEWGDETTTRWVNTPHAAQANVNDLAARYQPDAIKAFADGWRYGSGVDTSSMDEPTLTALVAAAQRQGLPVLTHTVTAARAASAGRAGVNVIAHSTLDRLLSESELAAVKQGGTAYAGTLAVYDPDKPRGEMSAERERRLRAMFAIGLNNMKALHTAGVPISLGTDAGMPGTPHGRSTLREMELMVSAGLSPTDTLLAATANSARATGKISTRGTIEVGKAADLVLLEGTPWTDIADVHNIRFTIVAGNVIFDSTHPQPAPAPHPPAIAVESVLIDNFDREDNRTSRNTLRVGDSDTGKERSRQVFDTRWENAARGRVLYLTAELAERDNPHAGVTLPLFPGSVSAGDVNAYSGVQADLRGLPGPVEVVLTTRSGIWRHEISTGSTWQTASVEFEAFKADQADRTWTGEHLVDVRFLIRRAGGQTVWLELDEVKFF